MSFAFVCVAHLCFASVGVRENSVGMGVVTDIDFINLEVVKVGSVAQVTQSDAGVELAIQAWGGVVYPPQSGQAAAGRQAPTGRDYLLSVAHLNTTTYIASPYYYIDDSYADFVVFPGHRRTPSSSGVISDTTYESMVAQAGSPMKYSFRVPSGFTTTPTFLVSCANSHVNDSKSGASTANRIDWDVVINRAGSAISSTRYNLDSVALTSTTNLQNVRLTYATPADFVAGDIVTIRIWREWGALVTDKTHPTADTTYRADATSDLYVFNVVFQYTF
jgi:hypothetical protein